MSLMKSRRRMVRQFVDSSCSFSSLSRSYNAELGERMIGGDELVDSC
jgi:hypothetical protein